MNYKRFEDLPVWNDAIDLAVVVYQLTATGSLNNRGDLKSQLERAVLSISNNIAEGFERGTINELLNFLYIARGSAGEVRSMLRFLERYPGWQDLLHNVQDLIRRAESISRQLGAWMESLKNSGYPDARSRNAQTRARAEAIRRRDDCMAKLQAIQDEAARARTTGSSRDGEREGDTSATEPRTRPSGHEPET